MFALPVILRVGASDVAAIHSTISGYIRAPLTLQNLPGLAEGRRFGLTQPKPRRLLWTVV